MQLEQGRILDAPHVSMYIAKRMKQGLRLNALISKYYFIICNDNQITINLNMSLYQYIKKSFILIKQINFT